MDRENYKESLDAGLCPQCGAELIYEGGCAHCPDCGFSVCGND